MNTHPDILELELSRTGEAAAETVSHLEACAACREQLTELAALEAGLSGEVPKIAIPEAVDRAVAEAAAAAAAAGADEAGKLTRSRADTADAPLAEVIRPSIWRKVVPVMGAVSAAAAMMLFFVSVAGDNVRSLMGASADALAGNEERSVNTAEAGMALEGHKNLADFSEHGSDMMEAAAEAAPSSGEMHKSLSDFGPSVTDTPVGGEVAAAALELTWAPDAAFSGTLTLRLELPAGARVVRVASARADDRVEHSLQGETELIVRLERSEPSAELLTLQLTLAGGGDEAPRLVSSELTGPDGQVKRVPVQLMRR